MPVVFGEVAEDTISRSSLPAAVTGTTINISLGELLVAARAMVPDLNRIALVGDSLDSQPAYRRLKEEIPIVTRDLAFNDLTGLAMTDLRQRVTALPDRSVIIYTTINLDGAGVSYVPAEALALVAEVANRPIAISTETFLGRGAVGGFLLTPASVGQDAARLASRILDGEDVSTIAATANKPIFDWRQLQRWGISESALPPGSEVRFREPSAWERYHWQITLTVAALLIQAGLIVGLIHEHRRRRRAEIAARNTISELEQMNRVATAGVLSASIAHEVNQPLMGIVASAGAALRWLSAATPDIDRTRTALTHIVDAGHRAGDVIGNIRAMFKKDTGDRTALNINNVVATVLSLVQTDLQRREIVVQAHLNQQLPTVTADRVQLQQVLLNLIVNAIESMEQVKDRPRVLRVRSEFNMPDEVLVSVEDSGAGIDAKAVERLFEPLFTTKSRGMGMGLSICRSIIEAHDGRLWAAAGADCGSVFRIVLPTSGHGR
jgi:signal transduction histidine kinase